MRRMVVMLVVVALLVAAWAVPALAAASASNGKASCVADDTTLVNAEQGKGFGGQLTAGTAAVAQAAQIKEGAPLKCPLS